MAEHPHTGGTRETGETMVDAPWMLVTTSPFGIRCQRCGDAWLIGLPGSVEAVLASVKAFADRHRACPEGDETIPPAAGATELPGLEEPSDV
jgi:hypothetical protein